MIGQNMEPPVKAVSLTKKYPAVRRYRDLILHPLHRKELTALHDITLQVNKGSLFALLGPNGAGKTTLIKILCTLVLPSSGQACVNGLDVTRYGKEARKLIGYVVSDERSFYWRLTGRQNLHFFARLNNMSPSRAEKQCRKLFDILNLTEHADRAFKDYSTGMKQKLAIARGLLTDPDILFMDEPTNGLDPVTARNVKAFVKEHLVDREGKTVIFATHNLQDAEEMCDELAIIHKGKVKFAGTVRDIQKNLHRERTCIVTADRSDDGLLERIRSIPFIRSVTSGDTQGNTSHMEIILDRDVSVSACMREVLRKGGNVLSFHEKTSSLHDLYLNMVDAQ